MLEGETLRLRNLLLMQVTLTHLLTQQNLLTTLH